MLAQVFLATGTEFCVSTMPPLRKLRNQSFAQMSSDSLETWRARQGCKKYVAHLVRRCQARASARRVLEDTYATVIGAIKVQILYRNSLMARFRDAAAGLQNRQVRSLPSVSEADAGLPAALLADRALAARDMPTLRNIVSGEEFVLQVDSSHSLHDFYVKAKQTLGLDPKGSVSLALLRAGSGTKDQRLLGCSRYSPAMPYVKGKVFEVYLHR